jgi:tetratricopeptide (TPR) repeat protein
VTRGDEIERAEQRLADGDAAEAYRLVGAVLEADPRDPRALYLAGRIDRLAGRFETAAERLERAADLAPEHVETHLELAALYRGARDFERCEDELSLALAYRPDSAEAYYELSQVRRAQGKREAACDDLRRAIEIDPRHTSALTDLGWLYAHLGRYKDALEMLERVIALDPRNVTAQNILGYTYVKLEEYDRALEVFSELCATAPRSLLGARINLGNAYDHAGRFDEAERVYEDVLRFEPNNFLARWNRAHLVLGRQDFEHGWQDYEYRLQVEASWKPRLIPYAPWKGEPLEGKSLLISAEQGLGDQIMFASCLGEVASRAARVVLECDNRLEALFRRSFPQVEVIGSKHEAVPPWLRRVGRTDYHLPAGSLPGLLRRRLADFPAHRGYLRADPDKVRRWRERVDALGPGLKVGISWRGGTSVTRRLFRTMALADLAPLLGLAGCRFVSLQYGDCVAELERARADCGVAIAHWDEAIRDYEETAALCGALDVTVSVCTSVIHLNGALGRPVLVMVPVSAEWRYGHRGETMPWYPSVRLIRQVERGEWSPVIESVAQALRGLAVMASVSPKT